MGKPDKNNDLITKRISSFRYAFKGILSGIMTQANLRMHLVAVVIVTASGFLLRVSFVEWIIIIILFGMVIAAELFNTAIESLTDLVSPQRQQKAGFVKDVAAGAVLVVAIAAAIIGIMIFLPRIIELF